MKPFSKKVTRRDFIKNSLMGLGLTAFHPAWDRVVRAQDFPVEKKLGRVLAMLELKSRPSMDSQSLGIVYDDAVVVWSREVLGDPFPMFPTNRKWIETPEGFLPAPLVQPVFLVSVVISGLNLSK